ARRRPCPVAAPLAGRAGAPRGRSDALGLAVELGGDLGPDRVHVEGAHLADQLLERVRGKGARLGEDHDPVADRHDRGYGGVVEALGERRLRLSVELAELGVGVLLTGLVDARREGVAGATPRGPEVQQDDALVGDLVEVVLGYLDRRHSDSCLVCVAFECAALEGLTLTRARAFHPSLRRGRASRNGGFRYPRTRPHAARPPVSRTGRRGRAGAAGSGTGPRHGGRMPEGGRGTAARPPGRPFPSRGPAAPAPHEPSRGAARRDIRRGSGACPAGRARPGAREDDRERGARCRARSTTLWPRWGAGCAGPAASSATCSPRPATWWPRSGAAWAGPAGGAATCSPSRAAAGWTPPRRGRRRGLAARRRNGGPSGSSARAGRRPPATRPTSPPARDATPPRWASS